MRFSTTKVFLLLISPTVIAAVVVVLLMTWKVPTRVEVELTTKRATFTLDDSLFQSSPILNSLEFQSISVEKFSSLRFEPETLDLANPEQYEFEKDRFPESAWNPVSVQTPEVTFRSPAGISNPLVVIEALKEERLGDSSTEFARIQPGGIVSMEITDQRDQTVTIHLSSENSTSIISSNKKSHEIEPFGALDRINGRAGMKIHLELSEQISDGLLIQLIAKDPTIPLRQDFRVFKPLQLISEDVTIQGVSGLNNQGEISQTFRGHLKQPFVRVTGKKSLAIKVKLSDNQATRLFSQGFLPVGTTDFSSLGGGGQPVSALVTEGKISYLEFPNIQPITFTPPDFLHLGNLKKFFIKNITLDSEQKGMFIKLQGIAGVLKTGSPDFPVDHRVTKFDTLWYHSRLGALLGILVWVSATSVGIYKFLKDFRP